MSQPSKTLKNLLLASLMLNVFLICGIGGGVYHWLVNTQPAMAAVNQHGLRQAMVQLPETRQRELRQLLRRNRADSQPLILAGRQARQDVIRQLEAPTLDRPALLADLGKAREADVALRSLVDNTLAEFAGTLPQEERRKLVESLYLRGQAKGKPLQKNL
ncbi:periplasmic heavy metal sensor [Pseudomonas batumici]|uniref:periplasmic heavy metal sensor n=1 Tax=Pseudomonas batumici TaxID=226910 RepID=UPI0030CBF5A9